MSIVCSLFICRWKMKGEIIWIVRVVKSFKAEHTLTGSLWGCWGNNWETLALSQSRPCWHPSWWTESQPETGKKNLYSQGCRSNLSCVKSMSMFFPPGWRPQIVRHYSPAPPSHKQPREPKIRMNEGNTPRIRSGEYSIPWPFPASQYIHFCQYRKSQSSREFSPEWFLCSWWTGTP